MWGYSYTLPRNSGFDRGSMVLTKQLSSNLARVQTVHAETLLLIADYKGSRVQYELRQKAEHNYI